MRGALAPRTTVPGTRVKANAKRLVVTGLKRASYRARYGSEITLAAAVLGLLSHPDAL